MNPLPPPEVVLEKLDPKPGEHAAYITREDVQYGWIYFLSRMAGLSTGTGTPGTPGSSTATAPAWTLSDNYLPGTLVVYNNVVYRATTTIPAMGPRPGTTTDWAPVGAEPKVSVALAVGQDPSNFPFTSTPRTGDILFNLPDKHTWVFGPQGWQHVLVPPIPSVFGGMLVTNAVTANQFQPSTLPPNDATNPGTYYVAAEAVAVPANFPTAALQGVTVKPGDWLVDDGVTWVWVQMSKETQTFVTTDTTGETPATWVFGTAPVNGDMFANVTDNRSWVRLPDPNAPATSIWVELTATPNTVTTTRPRQARRRTRSPSGSDAHPRRRLRQRRRLRTPGSSTAPRGRHCLASPCRTSR